MSDRGGNATNVHSDLRRHTYIQPHCRTGMEMGERVQWHCKPMRHASVSSEHAQLNLPCSLWKHPGDAWEARFTIATCLLQTTDDGISGS